MKKLKSIGIIFVLMFLSIMMASPSLATQENERLDDSSSSIQADEKIASLSGETQEDLELDDSSSVNMIQDADFSPDRQDENIWTHYKWIDNQNVDVNIKNGILSIESTEANHAMSQQTIMVEPNTVYHFSVQFRGENLIGQSIATGGFGVDNGPMIYLDETTADHWNKGDLYFQTAEDQTEVTINLSLGDYSQLAEGTIQFRNIRMNAVSEVPADAKIFYLQDYLVSELETEAEEETTPETVINAELWRIFLFAGIIAALLYSLYRWILTNGWDFSNRLTDNLAIIIILVGLVVRVALTLISKGYPNDTHTFAAWAQRVSTLGPASFYAPDYFADYPPGMMYLLALSGKINQFLGITNATHGLGLIVLMLPTFLCELVTIIIAYRYALKRWNNGIALGVCFLLTFYPVALFDGAMWHQVDPILTLALILTFIALDSKKISMNIVAGGLFGVAILLKPQALLVGPVFAMYYINRIITEFKVDNQRGYRMIGVTIATAVVSVGVIFLGALPFKGQQESMWLLEKYYTTGTSYPYASVNAYNLYALMGHNFQSQSDFIGQLPITYETLGNILLIMVIAMTIYLALQSRKNNTFDLFLLSAFIIMGVFCFAPRMHERYAYPALIFLVFAWMRIRDKDIMYTFIVLSGAQLANMVMALYGLNNMAIIPFPYAGVARLIMSLISVANIIGFVYLAITCYRIFVKGKISSDVGNISFVLEGAESTMIQNEMFEKEDSLVSEKEKTKLSIAKTKEDKENNMEHDYINNPYRRVRDSLDSSGQLRHWWSRRDTWFVLGLTLVYAIVAFINLGTTKVPQTYWRGSANERVLIDFGEQKTIKQIWTYSGIDEGTLVFAPEQAQDTPVLSVPLKYGDMYRWSVATAPEDETFTVDRLIMSIEDGRTWLEELAFIDPDGKVIKPKEVQLLIDYPESGSSIEEDYNKTSLDPKSNIRHLFDENNLIPERPDILNGMYFDEIYHARTAYEHLNGMDVYEWTHPPLGKILMGVGISIFGMNPFGWRFIGTLVGVLMVPLFYLLAKRLLKKTKFAFFATVLFTFDFMHFAQTRLATIDVYSVFFVLLMYYFMLEYWQMNFYTDGLKKTLRPLSLAGLFFGLGAASKWTCIYAGIGLAILLFASLYQRANEYMVVRAVLKKEESGSEEYERAERYVEQTKCFKRNTIITLFVCVVMFVIVPALIYFFSYMPYPFFNLNNMGETMTGFMKVQENMFNYHSGLTARHPFESTWISWIFDMRPIWYYAGNNDFLPNNMVASIASFGNPLVWWFSLVGFVALIIYSIKKKFTDKIALFLIIGLASQLLPWTFITRATFIYHYFGSVPFLILSLAYVLMKISEAGHKDVIDIILIVTMIVTILLFIMFYPALSGMLVPDTYAKALEWLPGWRFYSHR